jgi:hypothetical protein
MRWTSQPNCGRAHATAPRWLCLCRCCGRPSSTRATRWALFLDAYTLSPVSPVAVLVQCVSRPLSLALTAAALLGTIPLGSLLSALSPPELLPRRTPVELVRLGERLALQSPQKGDAVKRRLLQSWRLHTCFELCLMHHLDPWLKGRL